LGAGDEAGSPGAGAEFAGRFEGGGDDLRVGGETEVIVGGEVVQGLAVEAHKRTGREVGDAEAAAEVSVLEVGEGFLQVVFEHCWAGIFNHGGRGVH
jgi:hypothetical protein